MVYNRSFDGGLTWEAADQCSMESTDPRFLHDKNSMTADPNDRLRLCGAGIASSRRDGDVQVREPARRSASKARSCFTRTTDGGENWEPARKIYETGANKQTIGNQIVVEPASSGGSLFDFFSDVTNASRRRGTIGPVGLSYIRSDNRGDDLDEADAGRRASSRCRCSAPDSVIDMEPVPCPDTRRQGACPIRAGDVIPEVAVEPLEREPVRGLDGCALRRLRHDSIAFSEVDDGG